MMFSMGIDFHVSKLPSNKETSLLKGDACWVCGILCPVTKERRSTLGPPWIKGRGHEKLLLPDWKERSLAP